MALPIRPLAPADLPALWEIFQEIVAEGATYAHDETTTREAFLAYWTGRGGEQWVAGEGAEVLGGYTVRPNQPGRGAHIATASYAVARSARGQGVGRALGEHSIRRAGALGFRALQFNLVVSTNTAAVKLWRALGFSIAATLPGAFRHADAGAVDAYVMWRDL